MILDYGKFFLFIKINNNFPSSGFDRIPPSVRLVSIKNFLQYVS